MLRSLLRPVRSAANSSPNLSAILIPTTVTTTATSPRPSTTTTGSTDYQFQTTRTFSLKPNLRKSKSKSKNSKDDEKDKNKSKSKFKFKPDDGASLGATDSSVDDFIGDRDRLLANDENDKSLDVGPNRRPLFTSVSSLSDLTKEDACSYMKFNIEKLNEELPEGLPSGMLKEFEDSKRSALLIRRSFLDLRDNFRRIVDPSLPSFSSEGSKAQKQIVLDGPVSCGKSIALAMLVQWAREENWLVLYVPKGREWTHGGLFYKNPKTDLWDTPVQAANILQDFVKYNKSSLEQLLCKILDPIPLGEGAGVGPMKDADSMALPEGSTIYDLVQTGLTYTHASVGVVVRLRKELSLVDDMPVLIAIDQYNSWFTFTEFMEPVTNRSLKAIHAREVATVKAFRSMMHDNMMVGAFSHSTAVGKLRQQLPDVPADARVDFPRYSLDEADTVCHYYLRQRLIPREAFSEDAWKKIFYLSNGNGAEMRWLLPFMR